MIGFLWSFVVCVVAISDNVPLKLSDYNILMKFYDATKCKEAAFCPSFDAGEACPPLMASANSERLECLNGSVTEIGLYNMATALTGTLPTELGGLSSLTTLYVFGFGGDQNGLSGTFPTQLGMLRSLNLLNLAGNRLVGSLPTQIGKLKKLYEFRVHNNNFGGSLPTEMSEWSQIMHVHLHNNKFVGTAPKFQFPTSQSQSGWTCDAMTGGIKGTINVMETNCLFPCLSPLCCRVVWPATCPPLPLTTTGKTASAPNITTATTIMMTTTPTTNDATSTSDVSNDSLPLPVANTSDTSSTIEMNDDSDSVDGGGDGGGGGRGALIGGIVGGVVALIVLLVALTVFLVRRRRKQPSLRENAEQQKTLTIEPTSSTRMYDKLPAGWDDYQPAPVPPQSNYAQTTEPLDF
jgi:hypothetical protein